MFPQRAIRHPHTLYFGEEVKRGGKAKKMPVLVGNVLDVCALSLLYPLDNSARQMLSSLFRR